VQFYSPRKQRHLAVRYNAVLLTSTTAPSGSLKKCSSTNLDNSAIWQSEIQCSSTHLDNSAIWQPEELAVEFSKTVEMDRVDGDVGGDLAFRYRTHSLIFLQAALRPNALLHLQENIKDITQCTDPQNFKLLPMQWIYFDLLKACKGVFFCVF